MLPASALAALLLCTSLLTLLILEEESAPSSLPFFNQPAAGLQGEIAAAAPHANLPSRIDDSHLSAREQQLVLNHGAARASAAFERAGGGGARCERLRRDDDRDWCALADFLEPAPGRFLYYQHIRKAAGTWFCDLAQENTEDGFRKQRRVGEGGERCFLPGEPHAFLYRHANEHLVSRAAQYKQRIVAAEWESFQERRFDLLAKGVAFATLLREPVDRIYSLYVYEHIEGRDGWLRQHPGEEPVSFERWVQGKPETSDFQTRIFGGRYYLPDAMPEFPSDNGPVTEAQFEAAKRVLRRFHVVLTMDDLAEGRRYLRRLLGWRANSTATVINQSGASRRGPSPEERAMLAERNVWDTKLYAFARELFTERAACDHLTPARDRCAPPARVPAGTHIDLEDDDDRDEALRGAASRRHIEDGATVDAATFSTHWPLASLASANVLLALLLWAKLRGQGRGGAGSPETFESKNV